MARSFGLVPGEGMDDVDLELGNAGDDQENGVVHEPTLEQEVDNWDEHADDDWNDEEVGEDNKDKPIAGEEVEDSKAPKKRNE